MDSEETTAVSRTSISHAGQREIQPLDPKITSIQPGGGFCMSVEIAWGRLRRWYLSRFRAGYVRRMAQTRHGSPTGYPHPVLDPRDLKFCRNQGTLGWDLQDDPFAWRDRLPFVRVGLAEIVILGSSLLLLSVISYFLFWPLAVVPLVFALFILYFFRDPSREAPSEPGTVVAPADGRIFSVREVAYDDVLQGPAVVVDIFLSVFNVHVNRVPVDCRVLHIAYCPGKFLNALRPEAARFNESLELQVEATSFPFRVMRVRQITGAIARRIVCWVKPGEHLSKGCRYGMIKLGSRTELTIPKEAGIQIYARLGQRVKAGKTLLAKYEAAESPGNDS